MEMKTVRGVTPILLIMYLTTREFLSFSSKISSSLPQHDDDQYHQRFSSIFRIFICAKPSYLVIFLTFNILVVAAILLGISSKLASSSSSSSSFIELSILSFIDSYEGLKRVLKDEGHRELYEDDFIPGLVYVEYEEEKAQGESYKDGMICSSKKDEININNQELYEPYGYGCHDDQYKNDFIPEIVHVEYNNKEKVEGRNHHDVYGKKDEDTANDCKDDDLGEKDVILSYDEDNGFDDEDMISEEDSYSELDDFDLKKRIEEFIDENNKKWREELQNERLLIELD